MRRLRPDYETAFLLVVLVCSLGILWMLARGYAHADDAPQESPAGWSATNAGPAPQDAGRKRAPGAVSRSSGGSVSLLLARACWLEASFSFADCAAIEHVLERRAERAGVSLVEMVHRYTALRASNARARLARQLPDGDEPSFTVRENARWAELRAAVAAGQVDTCPGAQHWGGMRIAVDRARAHAAVRAGRWEVAKCIVSTSNTFFREIGGR